MPKPILKDNNLISIIKDNINLLKELDTNTNVELICDKDKITLNSDYEQLSRVFLNLIKNSIESIQAKKQNNHNYIGKITLVLNENDDYIEFTIVDNGEGFASFKNNFKSILNPYFTTKKKGTGLGLAIVNKILNDHNASIDFFEINDGAKIFIRFKK